MAPTTAAPVTAVARTEAQRALANYIERVHRPSPVETHITSSGHDEGFTDLQPLPFANTPSASAVAHLEGKRLSAKLFDSRGKKFREQYLSTGPPQDVALSYS